VKRWDLRCEKDEEILPERMVKRTGGDVCSRERERRGDYSN